MATPSMEMLTGNAGNLPAIGAKVAVGLGGLAAAFKLHESIDTDEQAIILNRGKVKLDRKKVATVFNPPDAGRIRRIWPNMRRARRIMDARAEFLGAANLNAGIDVPHRDAAEYAKIYGNGGKFTFFSMRSLRKIKTSQHISGLPKQRVMLNGELREVDSTVTWEIGNFGQNAARALLRVTSETDLEQKLVSTTAKESEEIIEDFDINQPGVRITSRDVYKNIGARCATSLNADYGIVLKNYEIGTKGLSEAERSRRIIFEVPGEGNPTSREVGERALSLVVGHQASQPVLDDSGT